MRPRFQSLQSSGWVPADHQVDNTLTAEGSEKKQLFSQVLDISAGLRGVPISSLLAGASRLLRIGAIRDPAKVYANSISVERLDFFISHAWRSPWLPKCVSLWFYFNANLAIGISLTLMLVSLHVEIFAPESVPDLFIVSDRSRIDGTPHSRVILCSTTVAFAFCLLLTHLHSLRWRTEVAFLDVACVDQLDAANKAKGIASLGATLSRTERLVILSDETYWTRLWTVFEVAAFYRRAGMSRMDLVSLHAVLREATITLLCLAIAVAQPLAMKLGAIQHSRMGEPSSIASFILVVTLPSCAVPLFAFAWAEHHAQRSRAALRALSHFSIEQLGCSSPEDQEALLALIGEWYTDHNAGETDARRLRQLGHHNFEQLVRHEIAPCLIALEGGYQSCSLRVFLVTFVPLALDALAAPLPLGHSLELALNRLCIGVMLVPAFFLVARVVCAVGVRVEGPAPASNSRAAAGLTISVALLFLFMLVFSVFAFFVTEPGAHYHPTRQCATDDGLDAATRAIWKWKVALALSALSVLLMFALPVAQRSR